MSKWEDLSKKDKKKIINDLYRFYRYFVASSFKENLPAKHIKEISRELMRMYRGDYQRLCVAQPPRTSKSSLITLSYPFWLIVRNPKLDILVVNNSLKRIFPSEIFKTEWHKRYHELAELLDKYL